jgi:serine/threonine-protein kinase
MSIVYRATDLRLRREVAVKLLPPNLAADALVARRFETEARRVAAISHPNLVTIYDVGEDLGDPFYVMEVIEGETLEQLVRREPELPVPAVARLTAEIAGALDALHADHLVHRDVKPANILMSRDGHAHLADFGLVRGEPDGMTAPGIAVGTLSYLAPELLRGEDATAASDTYALGAVAYRALTGSLPYAARTVANLVEAQALPPAAPSTLRPELSGDVDAAVLRALGPQDRRPTATDFASAFTSAAESPGRDAGQIGAERPAALVAFPALAAALGPTVAGDAARADGSRVPGWVVGPPSTEAPVPPADPTEVDTVLDSHAAASMPALPALPAAAATSGSARGLPHVRAASIAIAAVFLFAVAAAAGFPRSSRQSLAGELQTASRGVAISTEPSRTDAPAGPSATQAAPPVVLADVRTTPRTPTVSQTAELPTAVGPNDNRHKTSKNDHEPKKHGPDKHRHDKAHAKHDKHEKKKDDRKKGHGDRRDGRGHGAD